MANNDSVPYFVLCLDDNPETPTAERRTKALFTVPKELAAQLVVHDILCRGASFQLQAEEDSPKHGGTAFLSTIFKSPQPQQLALELARRIAIRMDNVDKFQVTGEVGNDAVSILGL